MSHFSTSKMLGKLTIGKAKAQTESQLSQKDQDTDGVVVAPHLQLSAAPDMKEVLANILGPSFSKKNTPMDKR